MVQSNEMEMSAHQHLKETLNLIVETFSLDEMIDLQDGHDPERIHQELEHIWRDERLRADLIEWVSVGASCGEVGELSKSLERYASLLSSVLPPE